MDMGRDAEQGVVEPAYRPVAEDYAGALPGTASERPRQLPADAQSAQVPKISTVWATLT